MQQDKPNRSQPQPAQWHQMLCVMRNLNRKHYCSGELLVHWLHYEPRIGSIIPSRAERQCMACLCFLMVLFFAIEGRQPDKGTLRRSFIDNFCPGHINPHKGDPKLAGGKRKWASRRRRGRRRRRRRRELVANLKTKLNMPCQALPYCTSICM